MRFPNRFPTSTVVILLILLAVEYWKPLDVKALVQIVLVFLVIGLFSIVELLDDIRSQLDTKLNDLRDGKKEILDNLWNIIPTRIDNIVKELKSMDDQPSSGGDGGDGS